MENTAAINNVNMISSAGTINNANMVAELEKKARKTDKGVKSYQNFIIRAAVLLIVIWALFFKVVGITQMPNEDMYPRLDAGDILLFYRLDKDVRPQDIVVLEKQGTSGKNKDLYVGRVVARAGDTVNINEAGHLVINNNAVVESNIFYETYAYEGFTQFPLTLREGEYFVLSDNRDGGTDSRYYGVVSKKELLGTVITVIRRNNL